MRKIIEITSGIRNDISKDIDLSKIKIRRLWTIYDEDAILGSDLPLEDIVLKHNEGVFLEDRTHDWQITKNGLYFYSRVVETGIRIKILIEYDLIKEQQK